MAAMDSSPIYGQPDDIRTQLRKRVGGAANPSASQPGGWGLPGDGSSPSGPMPLPPTPPPAVNPGNLSVGINPGGGTGTAANPNALPASPALPAAGPSAPPPAVPGGFPVVQGTPVVGNAQPGSDATQPTAGVNTAPTTGQTTQDPARAAAIEALYEKYLGRTGNATDRGAADPGYTDFVNGGMSLADIENAIKGSSEATAYGAKSAGPTKPSGGNLRDPSYAAQLVAYYAKQPGANPSLTNDPNYWIGKITSGALGADEGYIIQRFMTPEGAPVGSGAPGGGVSGSVAPVSDYTKSIRDILSKRLGIDQQPVDENAPEIAQPFEAAQLQSGRGAQAANSIAAEQAYAAAARGGGGVDQGALARQGQQAAEQQATGLAGIKSQLIQRAYTNKMAEMQDDLRMALASGDQETAYKIQLALADLQATLTREGYGINLAALANQQNNNPVTATAS